MFRFSAIVEFICLLGAVNSLVCHEGFNVSLAGIPFYYWAIHSCAKESECFVQEISDEPPDSKMKGIDVRFGGCISKSLAPYMTCKQLYEENSSMTIDIAFDILRGMDNKLAKVVNDIIMDGHTHLARFFSRGKDIKEFYSGLVDFLESLGYDKAICEAALKKLEFAITGGNMASVLEEIESFVRAVKVSNQATEKLSDALLHFVLKLLDGRVPEGVMKYAIYGPGVLYPVFNSFHLSKEVDDVYTILAEGFESISTEDPQTTLSEEYHVLFLNALVIIQQFVSDMRPGSSERLCEITKKIIYVYKEAYPSSPEAEILAKISDIVKKYGLKINSLPSCLSHDFICAVNKKQKEQLIKDMRNNEIVKVHYYELATFQFGRVKNFLNESPEELAFMEELMNDILKWQEKKKKMV